MSRSEDLSRGFGIISKSVMRDSSIPGPARALYALLATYADDAGVCYPGNETLAKDLGCTVRSVQNWMIELAEHGVVERRPQYVDGRQTVTETVLTDACAWRGERSFAPEDEHSGYPGDEPAFIQNNTSSNNTSRNTSARKRASERKVATAAPQGYKVSQAVIDWAERRHKITNVDWLQRVAEEFIIWAESVGKKYADWDKAVMNAVNREVRPRQGSSGGAPAAEGDEPSEYEIREWVKQHRAQLTRDDPRRARMDAIQLELEQGDPPTPEWLELSRELEAEVRAAAIAALKGLS